MATNLSNLGDHLPQDGPVPAVDPADLRSVWTIQARYEQPGVGINVNFYRRVLNPGANVGSVCYRSAMLKLLKVILDKAELPTPWMREGVPDNAVFKIFATIPMIGLQRGGMTSELPFNIEEAMKQIEGAVKELPSS
jgi:hypothetical protein